MDATNKKKIPTLKQFEALQGAYTYFNKELFGNELPGVILNLSRKSKAMGFAAPFRWRESTGKEGKGTIHEISINPSILTMSAVEVYSTLVHEMVHIWQFQFGNPTRNGYHNKEWAAKMLSVGLIPSDTGMIGGKMTGQNMSDYPEPDGKFGKALKMMPKRFVLPFVSIEGDKLLLISLLGAGEGNPTGTQPLPPKPKYTSKVKYSCPNCKMNAWGKPELSIICRDCLESYLDVHGSIDDDGLAGVTLVAQRKC